MIYYVRVQYADGSETHLGSDTAIEENKLNEIVEKLEVIVDQHFAIEISPCSEQGDNWSQVRFRVGGSYSEPQLFRCLAQKLVAEGQDSI